ncbi:(Fe-S)-binding protein [Fundidesulfovibrio butyratiphilus]
MADLNTMIRQLEELDDQLVNCMRCGMCQSVCPLYAETGREADVARGKIALLEFLGHKMTRDAKGVKERLDNCLLCGSCAAACPSGVKVLDIFLKARSIVTAYLGLSPIKKAIFHGMLARPALFNGLLRLGARFQGFFTNPASEVLGTSCSRLMAPILGDRHFPALARTAFRDRGDVNMPAGEGGLRVAFFYGCMTDKMFPSIGHAVLKVLKHHGVGVFMPVGQACCGVPSLASGDMASFETLVRTNLKHFGKGDFDYLVTPCGTCTEAFHHIWPLMNSGFTDEERARIDMLKAKALDINAFLVDVLGVAPAHASPDARTVTIHDPCHLKKSLGVSGQVRALVGANPDLRVVEMAGADVCCGCGGSFNLQHYEESKKIGRKKRDNIVAAGAEVVATGCPACMMQITDMLSHAGDRVAVKHPVELYAQSLGR